MMLQNQDDRDQTTPGGSGLPPAAPGAPPPPGAPPQGDLQTLSLNSGVKWGAGLPGAGAAGPHGDFGMKSNYSNPLGLGSDISGQIKGFLGDVLSGKQLPFGPDQIADLTAQAKSNTEGAAGASAAAVRADAIRRGIYRSGITSRNVADVRRNADTQFSQQASTIRITAAKENFAAKMGALDRAQKWLDSMREFVARMDSNDAQRQAAAANIALGYARIEAERQNLEKQLQAQKDLVEGQKIPVNLGNGQTVLVPPSALGSIQ